MSLPEGLGTGDEFLEDEVNGGVMVDDAEVEERRADEREGHRHAREVQHKGDQYGQITDHALTSSSTPSTRPYFLMDCQSFTMKMKDQIAMSRKLMDREEEIQAEETPRIAVGLR